MRRKKFTEEERRRGRALAREIDACTFFDTRGPVFPSIDPRPFVDEFVKPPKVHGRAVSAIGAGMRRRARVLEMLAHAGDVGILSTQIAEQLGVLYPRANGILHELEKLGRAERRGQRGSPEIRWVAA